MAARIIFITGTDTEAGKTVLTALGLCYLQAGGKRVRAFKPFCSGSWNDTDLLRQLHKPSRPREQVSPWFFNEPVAPLIAARHENREVQLHDVLQTIHKAAAAVDVLLVEGAGGLLSPLGIGFNALTLIQEFKPEVLIAGRNRIGIINHALLTIACLESHRLHSWKFALMGGNQDPSSATNHETLMDCVDGGSERVHSIPEFDRFDETNAPAIAASCSPVLDRLFG
jgi:dethiobiotin synthetase